MTDMSVGGDEDRWILMERSSSADLPLVVRSRVNPAIAQFAEENYVTAVICDVEPAYVRDDGFPTCMDALYDHEDRLMQAVAATGAQAYHTASVTGDGRRTIYLAHGQNSDFREMLANVRSEVATVSVFTDFEFATYSDFVTATDLDLQFDGDRRVMANLQEHGDDGAKPRKIDFWFYGDRSSLDQLIEKLAPAGLVVDHWIDEPMGVVLSIEAPANFESFHALTPLLTDAARVVGVTYDGWETLVLREQADELTPAPKPSLFGRLFGQRKQ